MSKDLERFYGAWNDQEEEKEQRRRERIGNILKTISWLGLILPVVMPKINDLVSFLLWCFVAFVWWIPFSWIGGKIARDW